MDKVLEILSPLQILNDYLSIEITEAESISDKVSDFVEVSRKGCCKEDELKPEEEYLINKIRDREKEFTVVIKRLEDLQKEYDSLAVYGDANNHIALSYKEAITKFDYKKGLLGIEITAQFIETTLQTKIVFPGEKLVILDYDILCNTFKLRDMMPRHKLFEQMRTLLEESGDIVGFLYHVRKFFQQRAA